MNPLAGKRILVTRPAQQADALVQALEARAALAVRFPVLAIAAAADPRPLEAVAACLDEFDYAVFVSPNAAEKALTVLTAQRPWPARLQAVAMGQTSARTIARYGVASVITPEGDRYDSEALLERPEFAPAAIRGRRVVIFRGDGGRELLGETLAARGARVTHVTCYRRGRPDIDPAPLRALLAEQALDALTVTSSEGLRHLVAMVGTAHEAALKRLPLFVSHARIAAEARRLGFARPFVTPPGDAGLVQGLEEYFAALETRR